MGTPYYQIKDDLAQKGVAVFSSNYCLYADMSKRIVKIIRSFSDFVEQYSIDESFVQFEANTNNIEQERIRLHALAEEIHFTILKKTGVPVRVSIAETKTLAKVGSEYTKCLIKQGIVPAVCFWEHPDKDGYMKTLPVNDVWGIGRQWSKKLEMSGIKTAKDLSMANPDLLKKNYSIVMERTARELSGFSCILFELVAPERKSLVRSRMFSHKITDAKYLKQAISFHLARASEKLRSDKLMATELSIFMSTGRHTEITKYSYAHQTLLRPTNDIIILAEVADKLFKECYVKNDKFGNEYKYSKAGVSLSGFSSIDKQSEPLFDIGITERPALMKILDGLNRKFGKHTVVLASMGVPKKLQKIEAAKDDAIEWGMKRGLMSKRFTTVWEEILQVKI